MHDTVAVGVRTKAVGKADPETSHEGTHLIGMLVRVTRALALPDMTKTPVSFMEKVRGVPPAEMTELSEALWSNSRSLE